LTEPVPQVKAGQTSPALWFLGGRGLGVGRWEIGVMFRLEHFILQKICGTSR